MGEGRGGNHVRPSSTRNPKLSPRSKPVLLTGVSSPRRGVIGDDPLQESFP